MGAMKADVGEEALNDDDKIYLEFADRFEREFVTQDMHANRKIFGYLSQDTKEDGSLEIGWKILRIFRPDMLSKVEQKFKNRFMDPNTYEQQAFDLLKEDAIAYAKKKAKEAEKEREAAA